MKATEHGCTGDGRSLAILTVALGVGANTAVFSVIHALLLRPLPPTRSATKVDPLVALRYE